MGNYYLILNKPTLLKVRYKFKDDPKHVTISITHEQYQNLLVLPIIETCEIIGNTSQQLTDKEKQAFNERIKRILKNDTSHTQFLLK